MAVLSSGGRITASHTLSMVTSVLLASTPGLGAPALQGRWQDVIIEQGQKVIAHRSDGRVESYSLRDFEGAQAFVDLKFSPDRRYVGWEVTYSQVEESYPVSLEVIVIGPSTTLRLNNGMALRTWRFLPNQKLQLCTGTVHGDQNDKCVVYALPE